MPALNEIQESIEARLDELKHEMTALTTARAALRERHTATTPRASTTRAPAPRRQRAAVTSRAAQLTPQPSQGDASPARPAAATADTSASRPAKRRRQPRSSRSVEVLMADRLETMLSEAPDGLSAVTIATRADAGYDQVLALLKQLERDGRLRRTGARRTSRWRLITDEERIAERAAELARLSTSAS